MTIKARSKCHHDLFVIQLCFNDRFSPQTVVEILHGRRKKVIRIINLNKIVLKKI